MVPEPLAGIEVKARVLGPGVGSDKSRRRLPVEI